MFVIKYFVKKYKQVKIESFSGAKKYFWAFEMLFIAILMSLLFGLVSEAVISSAGIVVAVIIICLFIFLSVISDMIGIAAASADIEVFKQWEKRGVRGAIRGIKLCENSEKVCSFCADVIGDICSTLCGAGGVAITTMATRNFEQNWKVVLVSIFTSALIAGLMVFFKAIMKERAMKKSNKILLILGRILNVFSKM